MSNTTSERNKAIVLEAFQALFNKRDYKLRSACGLQITFSTVPISPRAAMGCSG
jgi:hypothetical protein